MLRLGPCAQGPPATDDFRLVAEADLGTGCGGSRRGHRSTLLHSLSHLLINELAEECGYSASSLAAYKVPKVAICDRTAVFVTSAYLTGSVSERNLEVGVLAAPDAAACPHKRGGSKAPATRETPHLASILLG